MLNDKGLKFTSSRRALILPRFSYKAHYNLVRRRRRWTKTLQHLQVLEDKNEFNREEKNINDAADLSGDSSWILTKFLQRMKWNVSSNKTVWRHFDEDIDQLLELASLGSAQETILKFLICSEYGVLSTPTDLKTRRLNDDPNCKLCCRLANLEHMSSCNVPLTDRRYR
ncbi:hypothetical protein CHS0354_021202 [Potamilus streckersoni]|uniref:Uncharacterized protein n=1 Tax=Potamilus streckersoni TaxID=2493646 RepID=A0AAE0SRV2_9BIVA|nr:hypothetical protein CHS0354_021202 [Potamilus streckersoni]